MQIHHQGTTERNAKLGQKGSGRGHLTYFRNFGKPSISRERLELKTPNLARRFITRGTNDKNAKLGQKGSGRGHVTYYWNFGTPSISRERLKLETSNFACRFITRGTTERNVKLGKTGPESGHVTYFWSFGTPPYLGNGYCYKPQILHADSSPGYYRNKCKIRSKGVRKGSLDLL